MTHTLRPDVFGPINHAANMGLTSHSKLAVTVVSECQWHALLLSHSRSGWGQDMMLQNLSQEQSSARLLF